MRAGQLLSLGGLGFSQMCLHSHIVEGRICMFAVKRSLKGSRVGPQRWARGLLSSGTTQELTTSFGGRRHPVLFSNLTAPLDHPWASVPDSYRSVIPSSQILLLWTRDFGLGFRRL